MCQDLRVDLVGLNTCFGDSAHLGWVRQNDILSDFIKAIVDRAPAIARLENGCQRLIVSRESLPESTKSARYLGTCENVTGFIDNGDLRSGLVSIDTDV